MMSSLWKLYISTQHFQDVVVHVRDVSHPDYELQGSTVNSTLASLPLPSETPIITAANKMDLGITRSQDQLADAHLVSATAEEGIEGLLTILPHHRAVYYCDVYGLYFTYLFFQV